MIQLPLGVRRFELARYVSKVDTLGKHAFPLVLPTRDLINIHSFNYRPEFYPKIQVNWQISSTSPYSIHFKRHFFLGQFKSAGMMEYVSNRRAMLAKTSRKTIEALPKILRQLPNVDAKASTLYALRDLPTDANNRPQVWISKSAELEDQTFQDPKQPQVPVRVLNQDTLDAAIDLIDQGKALQEVSEEARVAVLNLASESTPGGGWLSGALAQEESLCYRSSLSLSLKKEFYPIPEDSAIYSPDVVIIRDAWSRGHELLNTQPNDLPVVSVISVAAIRRPRTVTLQPDFSGRVRRASRESGAQISRSGLPKDDVKISTEAERKLVYAKEEDRNLMKIKMRLFLRIAAKHGHRKLVLGALGCGAFRNPPEEVAKLWREILTEEEFTGGWWDNVVFAVLDKGSDGANAGIDREGNFKIFERVLTGLLV